MKALNKQEEICGFYVCGDTQALIIHIFEKGTGNQRQEAIAPQNMTYNQSNLSSILRELQYVLQASLGDKFLYGKE